MLRISDETIYAAFDPGLTTGLGVMDNKGEIKGYLPIRFTDLEDTLLNWKMYWEILPEVVVIEDYRLNGPQARRHEAIQSKMETTQATGMIKMWAKTNGIPYVEQQRDKKSVGYKYWGKKPLPKSNVANHAYDALAHLHYYMIKNKLIKVKI